MFPYTGAVTGTETDDEFYTLPLEINIGTFQPFNIVLKLISIYVFLQLDNMKQALPNKLAKHLEKTFGTPRPIP